MADWFYMLEDKQQGPLSEEDLCHIFDCEALPFSTAVWREGMEGWIAASACTAFQQGERRKHSEEVEIADTPVLSVEQGASSFKNRRFAAGFVLVGVIIALAAMLAKRTPDRSGASPMAAMPVPARGAAINTADGNTHEDAQIKKANPDPRHLVWIKPGTFTMGSPTSEANWNPNEVQHTVTISKGFWMGKYEVTQGEYLAVMGSNPSLFTGDMQRPVDQVTWYDVTNYCGKLSQQERAAGRLPAGYAYRLPTEAEWEYACRAGTATLFSYGDDPSYAQLGNYAWYDSNSGNTAHPVGEKLPNPWGLYDMHGNVWEWCLDWYGPYPGGSVTDPQGPPSGSDRVIRGGCWINDGWRCRSAIRRHDWPGNGYFYMGFRPVLAPGQ